ncbi:chymotrypsin-elastase inhibitor ixodidin-like [Lingula anatina]|uniref:Chymotrypsin-elastase inhibitor ixodidin-like n=1 Tax=Lingula anatina TaxID=7574 RepID=A0A1S3HQS4_LINAN|nr:chymotrypsin-elastase inhibitor ixodidin-like [Lingula anatina]|eukprot:XP_013388390.1 chymotrypsin-elastase inhibitor ixodidin-like [Lingula anatina]
MKVVAVFLLVLMAEVNCRTLTNEWGEHYCSGDLEWSNCYSSCPLVCGEPDPWICDLMCNEGCGCPGDKIRVSRDSDKCVDSRIECL